MALLYISDYSWCICFWCMHAPMLESVYFVNEAADLNSSINIISHLQDPPFFRVSPRAEYLQEFGRELIIPCQAHGDPAPHITWTKVSTQFPKIMIKKWQQINICSSFTNLVHIQSILRYCCAAHFLECFLDLYSRLGVHLPLHLQFCPMVLWFCIHSAKTIKGHGSVMLPIL